MRGFRFVVIVQVALLLGARLFAAPDGGDSTIRIWFSHIEPENLAMAAIAGEFTSLTGIEVEVVGRRSIFDAPRDLANNAELDDRPDIILMQAPDIGNMVASGLIVPLEIDDDLRKRYLDATFEAFTYNNKCYGIGYSLDTSGLIYNRDLISESELPETWDDFFRIAEALALRNEDGKIVQYGTLLNPKDMWFNYPIIKDHGGYYYGKAPNGDYNPYDVGLDNDCMLDYVNRMKELQKKGLTLANENGTESHISAEFANGRAAMILYGLWNASIYQSMCVDYGIAPLPKGRNGEVSRPLATVQGFVVNRFTRNMEAVESFLEFVLRDENQQKLIEAGNRAERRTGERNPCNISVIESDYVSKDPILSSLSAIGFNCEPFPNIPEGTIWYNYTSTAFRTIFYGDKSGNPVDAKEKLTELANKIRGDVAVMNKVPEKIEIPTGYLVFFASLAAAGLAFLLVWRRRSAAPGEIAERYGRKESIVAWLMLAPLFFLLSMFYIFPVFHNIYLSLTNYSGVNLRDYGIVGLSNYVEIFSTGINGLVSMIIWTVAFAATVVGLSFLAGTVLAVVLDKVKVRIAKIYKIVFILPWVVPSVITLLMWRGMLESDGLVNRLLGIMGMPPVPWLTSSFVAKLSCIFVMSWFSFPYFMVVSSGVLKSIPRDYYEVAKIAGAGNAFIFFKITVPLVFKALFPMMIMSFIMQFNQFGVYLLTQGGPPGDVLGSPGSTDLLITYVFNTAFNTKRYSLAAAYSVIIFCFVGLFAFVSLRIGKRKIYE